VPLALEPGEVSRAAVVGKAQIVFSSMLFKSSIQAFLSAPFVAKFAQNCGVYIVNSNK